MRFGILRFGVFALLVVGLHVGCDRLDDHLFSLLNDVDALLDAVLVWLVRVVCGWWDASRGTVETLSYRALDLVDLDVKQSAARALAAVFELLADALLAAPVLWYRADVVAWSSLRASLRMTFIDPTVLRIVGPLATGLASFAGVFAVSRAMEVGTYALFVRIGIDSPLIADAAAVAGLIVLVAVSWRLMRLAIVGAVIHADRVAIRDLGALPRTRRRLRGLLAAAVVLPTSILAASATPVFGTLRALLKL